MASNPYVNKVVYGNSTLIDLSQDTATQADVAQGKYFHLPTGERVQGTASGGGGTGGITQDQDGYLVLSPDGGGGGGGGLEYEEGTFSPSEDIADTTISFSNSHTTPPIFVMLTETSSQSIGVANSNAILAISNPYTYLGYPIVNGTAERYGMTAITYASSSGLTTTSSGITTDFTMGTYVSPSYFRAYTTSSTRYWRAGRTYKWIAVWPPTT